MRGPCVTPHAFEKYGGRCDCRSATTSQDRQELENAVTVVQKLCGMVYVIHSSHLGAVVHTIRSVGTNVKPGKEPEQRAMALNYTTIFVGVYIYRRIFRF